MLFLCLIFYTDYSANIYELACCKLPTLLLSWTHYLPPWQPWHHSSTKQVVMLWGSVRSTSLFFSIPPTIPLFMMNDLFSLCWWKLKYSSVTLIAANAFVRLFVQFYASGEAGEKFRSTVNNRPVPALSPFHFKYQQAKTQPGCSFSDGAPTTPRPTSSFHLPPKLSGFGGPYSARNVEWSYL